VRAPHTADVGQHRAAALIDSDGQTERAPWRYRWHLRSERPGRLSPRHAGSSQAVVSSPWTRTPACPRQRPPVSVRELSFSDTAARRLTCPPRLPLRPHDAAAAAVNGASVPRAGSAVRGGALLWLEGAARAGARPVSRDARLSPRRVVWPEARGAPGVDALRVAVGSLGELEVGGVVAAAVAERVDVERRVARPRRGRAGFACRCRRSWWRTSS
jgi:hypothetical protein